MVASVVLFSGAVFVVGRAASRERSGGLRATLRTMMGFPAEKGGGDTAGGRKAEQATGAPFTAADGGTTESLPGGGSSTISEGGVGAGESTATSMSGTPTSAEPVAFLAGVVIDVPQVFEASVVVLGVHGAGPPEVVDVSVYRCRSLDRVDPRTGAPSTLESEAGSEIASLLVGRTVTAATTVGARSALGVGKRLDVHLVLLPAQDGVTFLIDRVL